MDEFYDLLDETPQDKGDKRKKSSDFLIREQDFMLYKRLELLLDPYLEVLLYKFVDTKAPFGVLLFYAEERSVRNVGTFLRNLKRESDLLIHLGEDQNAYILLCQDTTKDGMFVLSKRIIQKSSSLDLELNQSFLPRISLIIFEKKSLSKNYVRYLIMRDFLLMKEHDKVMAKVDLF